MMIRAPSFSAGMRLLKKPNRGLVWPVVKHPSGKVYTRVLRLLLCPKVVFHERYSTFQVTGEPRLSTFDSFREVLNNR